MECQVSGARNGRGVVGNSLGWYSICVLSQHYFERNDCHKRRIRVHTVNFIALKHWMRSNHHDEAQLPQWTLDAE